MSQSYKPKPTEGIEIQVDKDVLAKFSNQVMIGHDPESFEMRFLYMPPNENTGILLSHIILSPPHMKRLLHALADNIQRFEAAFGTIPEQVIPLGGSGKVQ